MCQDCGAATDGTCCRGEGSPYPFTAYGIRRADEIAQRAAHRWTVDLFDDAWSLLADDFATRTDAQAFADSFARTSRRPASALRVCEPVAQEQHLAGARILRATF